MRIGIFDSGIGGLTVLRSFYEARPNQDYFYFGDTAHLPYGTKSKEELKTYAEQAIAFLEQQGVDEIIIACGTISSVFYQQLKANVPLIDVMSPTIAFLKTQPIKKVGLMATPMTIKTGVFAHLLEEVGISVSSVACPTFVPLIEGGKIESKKMEEAIQEYCHQLDPDIEGLILGCTHYPLLKEQLKKIITVPILSLGEALPKPARGSTSSVDLYFSQVREPLKENVAGLLKGIPYKLHETKEKL